MKRTWISGSVLTAALIAGVTYTVLQPGESVAETIHAQYLENEQLTLEEIDSDGTNMWSMWKRDLSSKEADLPISSNKTLPFVRDDAEAMISVRILDGQLMVHAHELATFLQLEHTFYKDSLILQLVQDDTTLLFRGNTEIAYENGVKTPSSAMALQKGQDLLVPINVVANTFGYKLKWDTKNEAILFEEELEE